MTRFEDLAVGDEVASRELHLTRDRLVRYAGASGDFNPIHYRDDVAASVGLPGVLAHGMLTMGAAGAVAADWIDGLGPGVARVQDYQARFTRPVVVDHEAGAIVSVTARIAALDPEARTARIDLAAVCNGSTVLGKAQLVAVFA